MSILCFIFIVVTLADGFITEKLDTKDEEASLSESSERFPYDKIRLPDNVIPIEYTIHLHPNITDGKFRFTGDVKILLEVKNTTDSIILHSESKTHLYIGVEEYSAHGTKVSVKETLTHKKHGLLMVKLSTKLSRKKKYMLHILFSGDLSSGLSGFYKSSYKTKYGETRYIATTDFEPTGARKAFPCFDEPAMKAHFSIIMVREKIHSSLSNMPIKKQIIRKDGLVEDHFQKSVKMSTYLVAFVVTDFAHLSTTSERGVKVRVWAPKDLISQAQYAIKVAPKILDYYEKFFNIEFPLPKQDLIAIPDFASGAMENWGLITYRLTALLYDKNTTSTGKKQDVAIVIAHELAHQWFGNLVTMKWWNDLWLNEGFANFVESIGTDVVEKSLKIEDQFVNLNLHNSLDLDSKYDSHPISVKVKDPAEISEIFDVISYSKGASIIRMMRDFLGPYVFRNGLTSYLKKFKYQNAVSDNLWECLREATNQTINVKGIMDTWTLQMGYPVVNAFRDPHDNDMAIIAQERFVTDVKNKKDSKKSPFNYRWEIPLTFYFQHDRQMQRKWLHLDDQSLRMPWSARLGWFKVNVNQMGYYRVNYDSENWKALADQLEKDHKVFSETDRSNLLDDVFALAFTGRLNQSQALDLTKYLVKEKDYVPFYSAMSSLASIGRLLVNRPGYANYEKYLRKQISPIVHELGWDDKGSSLDKFLRNLVISSAVYHDMRDAVNIAVKMYNSWMMSNKSVPANLQSTVYSAGIKYGGEREWNYMFEKYKKSINPSEKDTFLYALTETSNTKILSNYLRYTMNKKIIKSQDTCRVISKIAENHIGAKMARDFVIKNWDFLFKRYGNDGIGRALSVFSKGKTREELDEAEQFLNNRQLGSGTMTAKRAIATIRNNISWLEENEKAVEQWLDNILHS